MQQLSNDIAGRSASGAVTILIDGSGFGVTGLIALFFLMLFAISQDVRK